MALGLVLRPDAPPSSSFHGKHLEVLEALA